MIVNNVIVYSNILVAGGSSNIASTIADQLYSFIYNSLYL